MSLLMIMAGGTGGHIYPALAVADELRSRGVDVVWLGTEAGLEARAVPKAGYDIEWIDIQGLRGKGVMRWIAMPWLLLRSVMQTLKVVRRRRPDAMLGMGGFVSGPGAIAAKLTGRPLVIHEQNAVGGLTNRWLSRVAAKVLTGFSDTFAGAEHVGNPVREEFFTVSTTDSLESRPLRLLVVGGSQGALALNRLVPEAVAAMDVERRPEVVHQCGRGRLDPVAARYEELGVRATTTEFIDDMADAYARADIVVCRSGAMTVAEVAATGTAAVFVPYPYAVSDHQSVNASALVKAGAAVSLREQTLESATLAELLTSLNDDRARVNEMARQAREFSKPDATRRVADVCEEVLHA